MKIKVECLGRFGTRDGGGMREWILVAAVLTVACGRDPGPGSGGGDTTSGSTSGVGGHGGVNKIGAGGAGGAGQGGSGGTVQAQVDTWCARVYSGYCKALYACCPMPSVLDNWDDEADCAAETVAACSNYTAWQGDGGRVMDQVIKGVARLDEVRLASCIAGLDAQALSCDSKLRLRLYRCLAAFQGNIPYGQTCSLNDDVSYAECGNGHCDDRICQPYVPNGGDCSASGARCDWTLGSACIGDVTCGQPVAQGQPCTQAGDCISRSCDVDGTNTCQAPTSDGLCGTITN